MKKKIFVEYESSKVFNLTPEWLQNAINKQIVSESGLSTVDVWKVEDEHSLKVGWF